MIRRLAVSGALAAAVLVGSPAALLNVSVATVVPVLLGCLEDACDQVKQDCRDKGLKPTNCKQEQSPVSDECKCDCVEK